MLHSFLLTKCYCIFHLHNKIPPKKKSKKLSWTSTSAWSSRKIPTNPTSTKMEDFQSIPISRDQKTCIIFSSIITVFMYSTHECFPIMHGHTAYSIMKKNIGQHLLAVMHFPWPIPYYENRPQYSSQSASFTFVANLLTSSLNFELFHQAEPVLVCAWYSLLFIYLYMYT